MDTNAKHPTMNRYVVVAALMSISAFLSGCLGIAPTETPIPSIGAIRSGSPNDTLVIMLPGRGDRADTFVEQGFPEEGEQLGFDTLAVDAHFGYYKERILLPRLQQDVILPARAAGYKNIWLLGISMGGFGSLLYVSEYPKEIDGVILIAPYLGNSKLARQIDASGGLAEWSGAADGFEDYEIAVWAWLQQATATSSGTPIILGFGESDRSAKTHAVLAAALDPSNVYTADGGHDWKTWRPLWHNIAVDLDNKGAWESSPLANGQ
jgi:pimeloyl-ACP methyl ester carboxylesterase